MPEETAKESAKASLHKIQSFDPESLRRTGELGATMDFSPIIGTSKNLVALYRRVPLGSLDSYSDSQCQVIYAKASQDYSMFEHIMQFQPDGESPARVRERYINGVTERYDQTFQVLMPFIAFAHGSEEEIMQVRSRFEEATLALKDQVKQASEDASELRSKSERAMSTLRSFTSEKGVSQQAIYFRNEAEKHDASARKWLGCTILAAILLSGYIYIVTYLDADNSLSQAALLHALAGKLVAFAALGYLLILSGKSYLSNKHNAVVNWHRHNALVTYKALVAAASDSDNSDIVLNNAARCIFAPQDTGYAKVGASGATPAVQIVRQTENVD